MYKYIREIFNHNLLKKLTFKNLGVYVHPQLKHSWEDFKKVLSFDKYIMYTISANKLFYEIKWQVVQ